MITELEAGGNDFAVNGQIWGVNGRGEGRTVGRVPSPRGGEQCPVRQ
jgi:hypothetical protein